mmetsp:Transcript_30050/g.69321  ORF Transcript_30050/g.69321 Transcript_30050/m.69321 type:complete len:99 (+) Transcript_30050:1788-2084(+)
MGFIGLADISVWEMIFASATPSLVDPVCAGGFEPDDGVVLLLVVTGDKKLAPRGANCIAVTGEEVDTWRLQNGAEGLRKSKTSTFPDDCPTAHRIPSP